MTNLQLLINNLIVELQALLEQIAPPKPDRISYDEVTKKISVDGREWLELMSVGTQVTIKPDHVVLNISRGIADNLATINWPEGTVPPPGNVTRMVPEQLQIITFTLPDGSYVVFTGPCKLVTNGARLLQSTGPGDVKVWFVKDLEAATNDAALDLAKQYPFQLNWPDRRPIGRSFPYRQSGVPAFRITGCGATPIKRDLKPVTTTISITALPTAKVSMHKD